MELHLLNLILVLAAALLGGGLASRLGYPSILGELVAGIVLGPPLLGFLSGDEALHVLGEVGVLLMMLYIGVHMDLGDLRRASRPGVLAAVGGFLVPAGLGFALALLFGTTAMAAIFIGLAMGVTSLATKSRILVDLGILDTRIAHVLIAGALLSDMAVLVAFAAVIAMATIGTLTGFAVVAELTLVALKVIFFLITAYLAGTRLLPALGRVLARSGSADRGFVVLVVVIVGLLFAEFAELAGVHAILGAFIAGLFVDTSILPRRMAQDVQHVLRTVSVGLLAPIFFVTAGFDVTFDVFSTDLVLLVLVVGVATVGKIAGTAFFYLPTGYGWREGVAVGAGMNGRGAVEIIVAEIALELGLIDQSVFSILVFMALATTATVPVLLTASVRWLKRRGELVRPGDRDGVLIIGAGDVARRMAAALQPARVRLIDTNPDHTRAAAEEGFDVVIGNALDENVLQKASVGMAGSLIAMTPNSTVNLLTAQLAAASFHVPELHVALNGADSGAFETLCAESGATQLFGRAIDLSGWDYALRSGAAREIVVSIDSPPADLADLLSGHRGVEIGFDGAALPDSVLPLVVVRGEARLMFDTAGELQSGDQVVAIARVDRVDEERPVTEFTVAEAS